MSSRRGPRLPRRRAIPEDAPGQDTAAAAPPLEDFERNVARRHAWLLRTGYRLTGDWHSVEDLVQIALARVCLAEPGIRQPVTVDTYVQRSLIVGGDVPAMKPR